MRGSGLSYNYGYGYFSSMIGSYTQPITDWIEENFGYGKSVFEMLLSLAVMILEIMLLSQIRANKNTR